MKQHCLLIVAHLSAILGATSLLAAQQPEQPAAESQSERKAAETAVSGDRVLAEREILMRQVEINAAARAEVLRAEAMRARAQQEPMFIDGRRP